MDKINQLSQDNFLNIFERLKANGKLTSPRGLKVLEVENFTYELPARVRFCNFEARKLNLDYIKREMLWYLRGDEYDTSICDYASMWKDLVNKDGTINSNYGQYIFSNKAWDVSVFEKAIQALQSDKDSRRASIPILSTRHLHMSTKDVPCTYALNFRIRDNKLNMSVHMRSQDAVFGMGNDAPCFSFIHELLWVSLIPSYPDLELGNYHHIADSFHVYERHFGVMESILSGSPYIPVECPPIVASEAEYLIALVQRPDFIKNLIAAPYEFTKWLTNLKEKETA